jgi:hypothetical protein
MNHTPIHFEIPADDVEKLAQFYRQLFGWKIEKAAMDYWMIETDPAGQGIGGGMMKRQMPQQQIMTYFQVESVGDSAARVKGLGGQVVVDKRAVPTMGYFAVCLDPQHNAFALWQTDPSAA